MAKYSQVKDVVSTAKHIIILQADNPDGDSLGSSLALEAIFTEMGKIVTLVCAVDTPAHLRYLSGWDRVVKDIPTTFDITVIVDTNTETLFENAQKTRGFEWVKTKPVIVLDHHTDSPGLSFATISIVEPVVATSELIHEIAVELGWPLPVDACEMMAISIMSDSLGLTTSSTTPNSFRVMADLVERGVDLAKLDAARRELMKKEPKLIPYKGELLKRVVFDGDGRVASIVIPWKEIEEYSPIYNPTMLVIDDMRMTVGVAIAIGYKVYSDGKITAKIRCNYGYAIANDLALQFGGGGHPYAAGFKILDGTPIDKLKIAVTSAAAELLDKIRLEV
jgi:bifunctional oligoribonuclease and PAP phosphatase NrnA